MLKRLKIKSTKIKLLVPHYRIMVEDIGEIYQISNGKEYFSLQVREGMEGYRIGDFLVTKKLGSIIHVKKKGKRKK